jgi:hypothetical protein
MLPWEELAAGCLFPALGRVRELDLFDFGVFGEETFNGCRLHAWAARAPAPRGVERVAKDSGREEPGARAGLGSEQNEGERGTESKDPVRGKSLRQAHTPDPPASQRRAENSLRGCPRQQPLRSVRALACARSLFLVHLYPNLLQRERSRLS